MKLIISEQQFKRTILEFLYFTDASYELTKKSDRLINLLKKFDFKTTKETDNTLTMTMFVGNEEIDEDFDYNEPEYYKDQEIFMHEPTQDEIDRFIRHKYQYYGYDEPTDVLPKKKRKTNKIKKPKKQYKLMRLSSEVDHGDYALMKWKMNRAIDNDPLHAEEYRILPYDDYRNHIKK